MRFRLEPVVPELLVSAMRNTCPLVDLMVVMVVLEVTYISWLIKG